MTPRRKEQLCMEWLYYCRSLGWSVEVLDKLGDLFWEKEGWRTFKGWRAAR